MEKCGSPRRSLRVMDIVRLLAPREGRCALLVLFGGARFIATSTEAGRMSGDFVDERGAPVENVFTHFVINVEEVEEQDHVEKPKQSKRSRRWRAAWWEGRGRGSPPGTRARGMLVSDPVSDKGGRRQRQLPGERSSLRSPDDALLAT